MRKSRLSKVEQRRLIEHFVAGTTARCAASSVGVNVKTACYYYHRLRIIISQQLEKESEEVINRSAQFTYPRGKPTGYYGKLPSDRSASSQGIVASYGE